MPNISVTQFSLFLIQHIHTLSAAHITLSHSITEIATLLLDHASLRENQPHPTLIVVVSRHQFGQFRFLDLRDTQKVRFVRFWDGFF